MRLDLLFGAAEAEARLRLLDRDALEPGESALAQLRLVTPVSVPARECFILRLPSPVLTVAGGVILDPDARRQRRRAPAVLRRLDALVGVTPDRIVAEALNEAGEKGVAVAKLAQLAGLAPSLTLAVLRRRTPPPIVTDHERFVIAAPALELLLAQLSEALASHREGVGDRALAGLLPQASGSAIEAAIARLVTAGKVRHAGGRIALADAARDSAEVARKHLEAVRMAETLKQAGLTPPEPWKLAPDPARRQLLERLVRDGIAVRAPDRVQKREFVFHRDAIVEAQRRLALLLKDNGLPVSEIGAALGISRKYSVPLLEHLDSIFFTRRVEDRRVLARQT
jgi:selenocysteine-specific elongation factor